MSFSPISYISTSYFLFWISTYDHLLTKYSSYSSSWVSYSYAPSLIFIINNHHIIISELLDVFAILIYLQPHPINWVLVLLLAYFLGILYLTEVIDVWISKNKVIIFCHVVFDESSFPYSFHNSPTWTDYSFADTRNDLCPMLIYPSSTTPTPHHHVHNSTSTTIGSLPSLTVPQCSSLGHTTLEYPIGSLLLLSNGLVNTIWFCWF